MRSDQWLHRKKPNRSRVLSHEMRLFRKLGTHELHGCQPKRAFFEHLTSQLKGQHGSTENGSKWVRCNWGEPTWASFFGRPALTNSQHMTTESHCTIYISQKTKSTDSEESMIVGLRWVATRAALPLVINQQPSTSTSNINRWAGSWISQSWSSSKFGDGTSHRPELVSPGSFRLDRVDTVGFLGRPGHCLGLGRKSRSALSQKRRYWG